MKSKVLITLVSAVLAASAYAQISFNSLGTQTLDFEGSVTNVISFVPPTTHGVAIAEPGYWGIGFENRFMFISTGVTGQWQGTYMSGFSNPFTNDINNNSNTAERFDNTVGFVPVGAGTAISGNWSLQFNSGSWSDKAYIFKIDNNTGSTITNWSIGLDNRFVDTSAGVSTLRFGYSTTYSAFSTPDGFHLTWSSPWTEVDSRTSTNSNAGASSITNIGGSFSAAVADGASLYVAVMYDFVSGGGGNAFIIDNLSISAVPEPSTLVLFGLGGVAVLLYRRRSRKV